MSAANDLRVAYISDGFPMWPLHIAQSIGLFKAQGINVILTVTGSSVKQMEAINRGDFDIGIQLPDHVVRAVNRGSDLFAFMAPAHAADIGLIAAPGIMSLNDLRGRTIAVDGARSGYALLLRRMLRSHGITDEDCQLIEVGGTKERVEALLENRAAAAFVNPPFDVALIAKGLVRLTSTLEAFPTYPGIVAAASRSWATEHEDLVVGFIRAYRLAFSWLSDANNRHTAISIACASLPVDHDAAAKAWAELIVRSEPALSAEGFNQVIDVVWEGDGLTVQKPNSEKFIDLCYFNKALQS